MEGLPIDLVDREEEFALLSQAYFRSLSGKGCAVFLQGEAGIGKTRLIEELLKRLDISQVHIASGQAHPGITLPYRPVSEAIRHPQGEQMSESEDEQTCPTSYKIRSYYWIEPKTGREYRTLHFYCPGLDEA